MNACLNCKSKLRGPFCCNCGQRAVGLKIPFYRTLGTILSEAMTFDSRTARTVIPFLFRPGELTRDYNAGRRVRYTSPLKVYLLMSLVLFMTVSIMAQLGALGVYDTVLPSSREDALALKATVEDIATQTLRENDADPHIEVPEWLKVDPDSMLGRVIARQVEQLEGMDDETRTVAILSKAMGMVPSLMFFLMPLLALSLRWWYFKTGFVYTEHLVFSLHMHAYAYLLLLVPLVFSELVVVEGVVIITTLYYFLALQRAYDAGWIMTVLRGGMALVTYWIILALGMMGALALSALQV